MSGKFYQVIIGHDLGHSDIGVSCRVIYSDLERAWESLGELLNSTFKKYHRGAISKIYSVDIDIEDCVVDIQFEYGIFKDRVQHRLLSIQEVYLVH